MGVMAPDNASIRRKKALLFLKTKKQKDFYSGARGKIRVMATAGGASAEIKVFWFFSSEKNILS
jgi:hypothetical protein